MKNLNKISVSTLLKTPKTKFEVIPPKNVGGDTFQVNTTPSRQISPISLAERLLGRGMDLILRRVLFDIRAGNSNLAKVLVKKVTMQCTKMKTHTDACYPCKINKTNHFRPILVTSVHKNWFFLIIEIYMGFPYIPEAVFSFLPKC